MNNLLTPYEVFGGEAGVLKLVTRFYEHMDSLPEAKAIRAMHEPDLSSARQKLFMFLSGWLGGPDLYQQAFGHPMLRRRHLPFPIDTAASMAWMYCMRKAVSEMEYAQHPTTLIILEKLQEVSDFMRNQAE